MSQRFCLLAALLLLVAAVNAFVVPTSQHRSLQCDTHLYERQWNFNEGQSPFGLKKNAETWNGRVAQMAFVITFLQELIQGKGVVETIQEGNPVSLALLGGFVVSVVGLTAFLALKGEEDYVANELEKK